MAWQDLGLWCWCSGIDLSNVSNKIKETIETLVQIWGWGRSGDRSEAGRTAPSAHQRQERWGRLVGADTLLPEPPGPHGHLKPMPTTELLMGTADLPSWHPCERGIKDLGRVAKMPKQLPTCTDSIGWHAVVHGITRSRTWLSDSTATTILLTSIESKCKLGGN